MTPDLDIPEFLRRPFDPTAKRRITRARTIERQIPWKGWNGKTRPRLPRSMEAAGWALLKEIERQEREDQKRKFAALRQLKAGKKKGRV